jgi:hypothetical protein
VPEQFLDGANVIACLQKVRGEAVSQCLRPNRPGDTRAGSGFANGPLRHGLVYLMPAPLARGA